MKLQWLVVVALVGCGGNSDKIGVAECDAYLDKAAACATRVGAATGDSLAKMRAMMADAWKQSAADSAQRDMLPKTCEAAIADAKKQVPQCEW